jgi:hypothetical protein
MDPLSLLISALVAGATSAAKDTAGAVIKDAYSGLKGLIVRKFGAAKPSLDGLEQKPSSEVKQASAKEDLAGAETDAEVMAQAKALLAAVLRDDPDTGRALGIDLAGVEAAFLQVGNVSASGTGVKLRDSKFSGGVTIGDVSAGRKDDAPQGP